MHVLILGARAPVCLEWARAFRASGWQVSAADSLRWPLTRASRAIDRYIRLPEPRHALDNWVTALGDTVTAHGIDLLLPTCEEAFYLAHQRHRLPPACRIFTSDFELMHRLHHKGRFAALTQGWDGDGDVMAPETLLLESGAQMRAMAPDAAAWVFKPAYSRFAARTLIRPAPHMLARAEPTQAQPWVAQRFVAGREYCSFSVLVDGKLTAHACYHPRHRVGSGSGIWFEPADPLALRAFVQQFGAATGYTGQVGFDFIEDGAGRFHVLECNPRGTSGVHLFGDQQQALIASLSPGAPLLTATQTPQMIALAMLLFAAPRLLLRPSTWPAFRRDYASGADVITRPGDSRPLLAQLPGLAEIIGRAITRRCSPLAAATADIEWNGQPLDGAAP